MGTIENGASRAWTAGPLYFDGKYVREESTDAATARIFEDDGHSDINARRDLPATANGQLYAAAPELYAALEMAKSELECAFHAQHALSSVHMNPAYKAVVAALSRARGSAQS